MRFLKEPGWHYGNTWSSFDIDTDVSVATVCKIENQKQENNILALHFHWNKKQLNINISCGSLIEKSGWHCHNPWSWSSILMFGEIGKQNHESNILSLNYSKLTRCSHGAHFGDPCKICP